MNKRPLIFAAVSAFAIMVALPASAKDHCDHKARMKAHIEEIDSNHDGSISKQERETVSAKRFADTDTNNDGKISAKEMRKSKEKHEAMREAKREEHHFSKMDENGDGKLTQDEFATRHDRRLARLDANDDGDISKEELEAGHDRKGKHGMHRRHEERRHAEECDKDA